MAASNGFMHNLSMAACEWFLMFLMFIDAALGFILTKFAHHCDLQTPCLFCMRLDHVFSNENPGSYLSLFCDQHRAEISCLISCDLHQKLVNVSELCDDCFMSIMNRNQCNHGSYKGKTGIKGYQKPFLNRNIVRGPSTSGTCSCCKRHWKGKPSSRRFIQPDPDSSVGPTKPPLPRIAGHSRYRRRNDFKRDRDRASGTCTPCNEDNLSVDTDLDLDALSDFGVADFRFYSDSDSEFSLFEDDCASIPENLGKKSDFGDDVSVRSVSVRKGNYRDDYCIRKANSSDNLSVRKGDDSCVRKADGSSVRQEKSCGDSRDDFCVRKGDSGDVAEPSSLKSEIPIQENKSRGISVTSRPQSINTSHVNDVKQNGSIHDNSPRSNNHEIHDHESEKSEGYESPDAKTSISDFKGEGIVERLKRQVEGDQQRLHLLHRELDEERNAAAIAADEAMAMITRLQEEKASLHMEALQYLRMMDEQAEYDMEALDKANDLLTEKDKEIQDLESELDYFRSRYEDELRNGNLKKDITNTGLVMEDEKKYILQSLSELEKKFSRSNGDVVNGERVKKEFDVENEILELNERLKAVEDDRSFLEHACSTLQSNGGLEFIQEIATHLHDLRRSRFDRS